MDVRRVDDVRPRCPYCQTSDGRIFKVLVKGVMKTLTFRCQGCERTWETAQHSPGIQPYAQRTYHEHR